jgi:hypothetical protein
VKGNSPAFYKKAFSATLFLLLMQAAHPALRAQIAMPKESVRQFFRQCK